jgi:iron complex transport system substrate-binding protein
MKNKSTVRLFPHRSPPATGQCRDDQLAAALVITSCGSGAEDTSDAGSSSPSGAFPVPIEHTFGTTTIADEPQKVVTWGFDSTDAALALGVVPVAIPCQAYGDDEGVLPWIADQLDELGVDTPPCCPTATRCLRGDRGC